MPRLFQAPSVVNLGLDMTRLTKDATAPTLHRVSSYLGTERYPAALLLRDALQSRVTLSCTFCLAPGESDEYRLHCERALERKCTGDLCLNRRRPLVLYPRGGAAVGVAQLTPLLQARGMQSDPICRLAFSTQRNQEGVAAAR